MTKKICILTDSLSSGGAEKVAANMSIALSKKGHEVTVFSMQDIINYSYNGHLYNFGLIKLKHNRIKAFIKLRQFFKENTFDYIIDHRLRDKFFKEVIFSKFIFNASHVIYCIHNYRLEYYFSFLSKPWLAIYPHAKNRTFVTVCKTIEEYLYSKLKLESVTIYNFLNFDDIDLSKESKSNYGDYVIGVGRLTNIKQFDKLIRSYYNSNLHQQGIKLLILGDGPEKKRLRSLIINLQLNNDVVFLAFRDNPFNLIKNAKALALTSKVEGFPMVLLEALTLNVPVVAFNCKSGPSEIIKNNVNGFLVDNQNEEDFTLALNKLLDNFLYNEIKKNTSLGLEVFLEDKVIQEWEKLFNQI
ncbi:glycosyltransferase [Postechiella marina]|uniref:Glycosyltransferase n=1 Tax=Postechiella marina TaxID=943941 RepID=A0ABP8CE68_9FLAO